MATKKKKYEYEKGRDWTFIVYPESAPKNWRTVLDETHIRWIESPLHDKDVNADGEVKKAHWHILISFDGPVTVTAVNKIIEPLNTPEPRKVGSGRGLVRYMIHLDNPEKYQYPVEEIIGHNGVDVADYFKMTATDSLTVMKDMINYIYENKVDNYADFLMTCIEHSDDWFDVAVNHNTLALNEMLDAMWQKNKASNEMIQKGDRL